jgi:hypothetical protein
MTPPTMHPRRAVAAAAVLAIVLLSVVAGPAAAQAPAPLASPVAGMPFAGVPWGAIPGSGAGGVGAAGCGPAHGSEFQGGSGGSSPITCVGSGLVFVGPSSMVNTTIGPTIISPGFAGVVTVANGPAAVTVP